MPHAIREMKYLPSWATHERHSRHVKCNKCAGWIRLSCNAIMVLCASSRHISVDGRGRSRKIIRGRVAKRFRRPGRPIVCFYDMKWGRAVRLRRPLLAYDNNSYEAHEGFGFLYSPESRRFKKYPLTDREWMLASAILYYLEGG